MQYDIEHAEPCRTDVRTKTLFQWNGSSTKALLNNPATDDQNRYTLKDEQYSTGDFQKRHHPFPEQVGASFVS